MTTTQKTTTKKVYCKVCGAELTAENRSKSYRSKCKYCVAKEQKEQREAKKAAAAQTHTVRIELCGGILPEKKHEGDACYDLYVPKDTELQDGRQIIKMGFRMQLPHGFCAQIRARSGYSSQGIEIKGTDERHDADVITGIVDENYRGEIGVILNNHKWRVMLNGKSVRPILAQGTRIAQMQIVAVPQTVLQVVDAVDENDARGEKGFGSSNVESR